MNAIYIILAVGGGLLMDWALFERLTTIFGAFGQAGDEHLYRNTFFPRAIITVLASIAFAISLLSEPERAAPAIAAAIIFFLTNLYGVLLVLRGGRPS